MINDILPKVKSNEGVLIVLLTDGYPQPVDASNQVPCLPPDRALITAALHDNKNYDSRFFVVAVEQEEGALANTAPFECLYEPYSNEESWISVSEFVDLSEISPKVKNTLYSTYCEVG